MPWWAESERALLHLLPTTVTRVLDIGTGDGRLIDLVRRARPVVAAIGLDLSPADDACKRSLWEALSPRAA